MCAESVVCWMFCKSRTFQIQDLFGLLRPSGEPRNVNGHAGGCPGCIRVCNTLFFFSDVQQVLEKRGTYTVYSTCFVV